MKRLMFRDASIIIDEVHLINLKMLALLFHFLRILFMSATFSDALIHLIKDKISAKVKVSDLSEGYKRLLRVNYDLNEGSILDEDINKIGRYLKVGKVLIVMNTVEAVVRMYRRLELVRGYFVPVPIWIVTKHIDIHAKGLPIVKFDKLAYTSKYGLIEKWLQT